MISDHESGPTGASQRLDHRLRTPLNVVMGYAQLLQADLPAGTAQAAAVDEILRAAGQIAAILEQARDSQRAAPAPPAGEVPQPAPMLRHPVLYVEDDASNRLLLRSALRPMADVELHVAASADEGMELARRLKPCLVLLDVCLPDRCGLDLLPELRAIPGLERVPVFGLSGRVMPCEVEQAEASGITAFLPKPLDIGQLLARIREHLRPHDDDIPCTNCTPR